MRKGLIIIGIVLAVIVGTMVAVPLLFQDKIYEEVKKAANEAVNAKVEIGSVELSLFRSFPKVSVELKEIEITCIGEFKDQVLFKVENIYTAINLSGLWSGNVDISNVTIDKPLVMLKVNSSGKANWDIVKATTEEEAKEETDDESNMVINLEKVEINNASFSYTDESSPLTFSLKNGNIVVSGEMRGNNSILDAKVKIENLTLDYEGTNYMKNVSIQIESEIQSDFEKMIFSLLDNEILVNKLPLKAEGSFSMPDDNYNFDISFTSPNSQLGELLGFIPAEYQSYIEGVETDGNFSFEGFIKGVYNYNEYPAFGLDINLKNGWLKYPELPDKIEGIEIVANVSKPQGDLDLIIINIKSIKASVKDNHVSGMLKVTTPLSDAKIVGNIDGKIDFSSLADVIPMDSVELKGIIDMEISFAGNYSDIEKEQYSSFKTGGTVVMQNFEYASNDLPEKVSISSAKMTLSPENIKLNELIGKVGRSDFAAKGSFSNYWAYILSNETLKGKMTLNSRLLDINQLMYEPNESPSETEKEKADTVSTVIEIPDNIHFIIQASINRMLYDKMVITNTKGKLIIKDKKLIIDGLNMHMLSGEVAVSGEYFTPDKNAPEFNFKMNLQDFNIPSAYRSLSTVRNLMPVAGNSTGSFSSGFTMKGKLGNDMSPLLQTLNGNGNFISNNVEIVGAKVFQEISKYFVKGKFDRVSVDDFKTKFKIVNGGMEVVPFKTNIAGQEATISGFQTVSQELNYNIDFMVNKKDLDKDVLGFMSFVPGMENIDKLPVGVRIEGTFTKPEVKVDLSEARKLVEAEFKKKSSKEIEGAAKKIGDQLKRFFK
jgi:uncharacterized protein involved in outer membrane biogenesis